MLRQAGPRGTCQSILWLLQQLGPGPGRSPRKKLLVRPADSA